MKVKQQKALKKSAVLKEEEAVEENKPTNDDEKDDAKTIKIGDKTLFEHFNGLTNEDEDERNEAALALLQRLTKTPDVEKRKREISYALKRLVRGCGASTNTSRAGFFTALTALLRTFPDDIMLVDIFATMKKELNVGSTIANKEDADAIVGKILVCGAILHSEMSKKADGEHLEKIVNGLLQSTHHRTYHSSLGYAFLMELMDTLTVEQFEASVWPMLHKELEKPWPKQTLQTVHCLIFAQRKFPSAINSKYLKAHFGGAELLNEGSFNQLQKIFWDHSNNTIVTHPGFELFGIYIAGCRKLSEFWTQVVDPGLKTPTKLLEIQTIKIATDILNNLNTEKTNVADLLSVNFMKLLVNGLRASKQKKDDTLNAFYTEFLEALTTCYGKLEQDAQKVEVIKRLILPPGAFNIEKYTHTRIIHQLINLLGKEGIKDVYDLYKDIFMDNMPKNAENAGEKWLNFERMNAGYMLQQLLAHKSVQDAYKWRQKQLSFLLNAGTFHLTDALEVCKKEACGSFSKDFGDQCKNMFYTSLQSKSHDMQNEKKVLQQLVKNCNERLQIKHAGKFLRLKAFNENSQKSWESMYQIVGDDNDMTKSEKKKLKKVQATEKADKLELVFHILLLHMGLQLFREPEMAAAAISDLLKCMERTKSHTNGKKNQKSAVNGDEEEPEWIEVVVDLFLHLLSQNAGVLRNIVNSLFPHFCGNLNLNAVHQILSVLDMKDGFNPLSTKAELLEKDESGDDEEIEKAESSNEEETDSDDDDDEDDEDEDGDDDGDVTATDKLRNAISQALIQNGVTADDDMDSVDLEDITEEEGQKLDEALANVFRAMKKTSEQNGGTKNKKSKGYRIQTTTVMHFRIKVLDLIEIYLQHQPSLLISIEIMLVLYDMLPHCLVHEFKPLQSKVEKVLSKLTTQKTYNVDDDLTEDSLTNFIRLIVEKKTSSAAYEIMNRLRNKCIIFLIGNANKIARENSPSPILSLCIEYLQDFVKSRNPIVNITLLSDMLKLRWLAVWQLSACLIEQANTTQIRAFRRIQIFELLLILYRNFELHKLDLNATKEAFTEIETYLAQHIQQLALSNSDKKSPKEFQTFLELLLQIHRSHQRLQWKQSAVLYSDATLEAVQQIRQSIRLDTSQMYQRFCSTFKLKQIRNNNQQTQNGTHNGKTSECSEDGANDSTIEEAMEENVDLKSATKRPLDNSMDARKLKKLKKMKRLEAASQGLNGGVPFGQRTTADDGYDD